MLWRRRSVAAFRYSAQTCNMQVIRKLGVEKAA